MNPTDEQMAEFMSKLAPVDASKGGGYIVPQSFFLMTTEVMKDSSDNLLRFLQEGFDDLPPLTRRELLVVRLRGYRWRISEAWDVLRGQHRCGDGDDW